MISKHDLCMVSMLSNQYRQAELSKGTKRATIAAVGVQGFTQWPTYPQLLVNGELLGGCDIVMEMQQDGTLKTAVREALGATVDDKSALQQRLKQLLDSNPVMLFMKVNSHTCCCNLPSSKLRFQGQSAMV